MTEEAPNWSGLSRFCLLGELSGIEVPVRAHGRRRAVGFPGFVKDEA
jgi:hypothetical protein